MNIREQSEKLERKYLSPYASLSCESQGRDREEEQCDIRTVYQRDRDRIIHCKAFRRMKHKTQVFLAPMGDHYRTRLTHTLEVCSQGFEHFKQSIRVVEILENNGKGLNLTKEVRDGIVNHSTSGNPSTLEGKVVRLSDKIAYINHDIDDAIRGKIITEKDIPKEYADILGDTTKVRLDTLIHDVVSHSIDKNDILMSPEVENAMMGLRKYMFKNVYTNPLAKSEETKAKAMLKMLFEYYMRNVELMPEEFIYLIEEKGQDEERVVCDYIAGMSDQYSVAKFQQIYEPGFWKMW